MVAVDLSYRYIFDAIDNAQLVGIHQRFPASRFGGLRQAADKVIAIGFTGELF
ncbi:hypothetical protein D3C86_2060960 [compost metagenome]